MQKLTKRQLQLLHAIEDLNNKNGAPPTIAELKKELYVNSDQSIYQLLEKLTQAGVITREPGKRRSIRILNSTTDKAEDQPADIPVLQERISQSFTMNAVQKNIFNKLHELDPHIANVYKGALFTMSQKDSHPDWVAQVANSFRGIFGILTRDEEGAAEKSEEAGTVKISKAFDPHGLIGKIEKAAWDHWNQLNRYFTAVAHYKKGYTSEEKVFLERVDEFNELLNKYILPDQLQIYEQMDKIIAAGPDKADQKDVRKYLSLNTAGYTYFFNNINEEWFDFLNSHKLLSPTYQVGQYLVVVSSAIPDKLVQLAKTYSDDYIKTKEDKFFRQFFISAALNFTPKQAHQIINLMIKQKWADDVPHHRDFLFYEAKKLLERLIDLKEYNIASTLAKKLLDVRAITEDKKILRDVEGYIDDYFYGEIIKSLEQIPLPDRLPFVKILISTLAKAVELSTDTKDRYSHIWRSYIGENERNRHNVIDVLIDGIRDLSIAHLRYIKTQGGNIPETIGELLSESDSHIFTRIKLYLYSQFSNECLEQIQWAIIEYFDNHNMEREYDELIKLEFGNIGSTFQKKYLELVARGPIETTKEDHELYSRYWKIRKLFWVKNWLDNKWKSIYLDLIGDDDESKFTPTYSGVITSWTGPTTPKKAEELADMSVASLIKFLSEWQPPTNSFGEPSRMGLGREMVEVIKNDPTKYAEEAMLFSDANLPPTFLHHYFNALKDAIRNNKEISWTPVIELMTLLITKAKNNDLPIIEREEDDWGIDWSNTFQNMVDLIENGLASSTVDIPFAHREDVWQIIEFICEDKEPDLEYEKKYGGDNSDYYHLSINTARGEAFHALFQYMFWCEKNLKSKSASKIPPEVKRVLENHLDTKVEPGMTVRSVYGRFFPWIYSFDEEWSKENIAKLFPLEDLPRRYAAWETYLLNAVYSKTFEDLRPQYAQAILELKKPSLKHSKGDLDPFERLINHLMIAYAYGIIEYDDALLKSFYNEANKEQLGTAVNFMGRVYIASENATREEDPEKDRLKSFWELRLNESTSIEELMEFGWWVKEGYFDDNWMLEKLLETLNKTNGIIEPNYRVLESLKKLATQHPLLVAQCLLKIVRSKRQDQFLRMAREEDVRSIVESLYKNENAQVRKIISQVSDHMLRLGNNDFRVFIRPIDEPIEPRDDVQEN